MRVGNLQSMTSSRLARLDISATLQAAAISLSAPGIGLVVICNGFGATEGVLSKSDLVRHLTDPAPSTPTVVALMSRPVVSCSPDDDLHSVWEKMAQRNLQNIPVTDEINRPIGVLDIRDAMKILFEQEELQERMLNNYIAGIGYR